MDDKPPFGFRQDVEQLPEPDAQDDKPREINCTTITQSMGWSRHVGSPLDANDAAKRHHR